MSHPAPMDSAGLLTRLCSQSGRSPTPRIAFVMAHPDDETVGASYLLGRAISPFMIYVTDGAPRDGEDAKAAGYATWVGYARARVRELKNALATAGVGDARLHFLNIPDQGASEDLVSITLELAELFRQQTPDVVVTHPYEGGHPDHDATALTVHAALALLEREHRTVPTLIEMTSYHLKDGGFRFGEFLNTSAEPEVAVTLDDGARARKERLVRCYPSQQRTLRSVPTDTERYRIAPRYDFTQAPHSGQLLYEKFCWKMTGVRWRRLALSAIDELGLAQALANNECAHFAAASSMKG